MEEGVVESRDIDGLKVIRRGPLFGIICCDGLEMGYYFC